MTLGSRLKTLVLVLTSVLMVLPRLGVSATAPTITSLSLYPAIVSAGSAVSLQVAGTGFVAGSTVYFGARQVSATFVDSTQLNITIPASATAGATASYTALITVRNPDGNVSNGYNFAVKVGPVITS